MKFAVKRSEWCNSDNFQIMYDAIYNELADAGVAVKMEGDGMWLDFLGKEVSKEKAFGRKCTHRLTHPDHFFLLMRWDPIQI